MSDEKRPRVQVMFDPKSKVEQSHRQRVNINSIMSKIRRGAPPPLRAGGLYGDFSNSTDFHGTFNRIQDAMEDFSRLPSDIRKRFNQDPGQLLDFIEDDQNRDEAVELGLVDKIDFPEPESPVAPTEPVMEPAITEPA